MGHIFYENDLKVSGTISPAYRGTVGTLKKTRSVDCRGA
jgi:hypothetical protein